jgi:hypothetical protein
LRREDKRRGGREREREGGGRGIDGRTGGECQAADVAGARVEVGAGRDGREVPRDVVGGLEVGLGGGELERVVVVLAAAAAAL